MAAGPRISRFTRSWCAAAQRLGDVERGRPRGVVLRAFTLPNLVGPDKALAEQSAGAHEVFAWAIGIVIALHLVATLWHVHVKRDTVFTRMWPRYRPSAKAP